MWSAGLGDRGSRPSVVRDPDFGGDRTRIGSRTDYRTITPIASEVCVTTLGIQMDVVELGDGPGRRVWEISTRSVL